MSNHTVKYSCIQKMLTPSVASFLALTAVAILGSCGDPAESVGNQEVESRITFSIDEPATGLASISGKALDVSAPNELIWIEVSQELPELFRKTLFAGQNEILIPKNGVYLMGFVYNATLSRSLPDSRSIAGGIQTVGNLGIVSAGFGSLPLSVAAEGFIDLGLLSQEGTSFSSGMQLSETASATGYAPGILMEFGQFDPSLLIFLNPDIDANGIYDQDESLGWAITQQKYLLFHQGDIQDDWSIPESIDAYVGQHNPVFWHNTKIAHPAMQDVFLHFPSDREYVTPSGELVEGVIPFYETRGDGLVPIRDPTNQYYFSLRGMDLLPKPPYNGDYLLEISGKLYYLNDLNVQEGDGGSYEGFTFPALRFELGSNNHISMIRCRWKTASGTGYREPSSEEIRLKIRELRFDFGGIASDPEANSPEYFGADYYDNFSIDVSSLNLDYTRLPPWGIACGYWDISGSDHRIEYPLDYLNPDNSARATSEK